MLSTNKRSNRTLYIGVHGFLGNKHDFDLCSPFFTKSDFVSIDLPGHGDERLCEIDSFDQASTLITQRLSSVAGNHSKIVLLGYSLGARLLMHAWVNDKLDHLPIQKIVIEGGNFGLQTESEKRFRWEKDRYWMRAFCQEPIELVLDEWYQQSVFQHLNVSQRARLVDERMDNWAISLSNMMKHTSLAKQEYLLPQLLSKTPEKIELIVGEFDQKFTYLYQECGLSSSTIKGAGHNTHKEQPQEFARTVIEVCGE